MKPRFGNKIIILALILVPVVTYWKNAEGQTTMGILPVGVSSVNSTVLDARQWQWISLQLHDYLVVQLAGPVNVRKLSREHILLLLKEMPSPDPENLDDEAYRIISKKEKMEYLLKCSVESCQQEDQRVLVQILVMILDGNSGKEFWKKSYKTNKGISKTEITEQILMDEIFKPAIEEISKEIKALNY